MFSDAFTDDTGVEFITKLASNELRLMKASSAVFNPTLVSLGLKLAACEAPDAQKIAKRITKFLWRKSQHPQITCAELIAKFPGAVSSKKKPRLEYL